MHKKNYHLTPIGGSVLHNLALFLKEQGHRVTGSDDEITEPGRSRLAAAGLLPPSAGWHPQQITPALDALIAGGRTGADHPEVVRARQLGIPVVSFQEFIYAQAANKQRIVVAGSHGKTTLTAIILHVLHHFNRPFDYVIGSQVPGLKHNIRLSADAPVIVIEGDDCVAFPPAAPTKLLQYRHHIGVISRLVWDDALAFRSEEEYIRQFEVFADATPKGGLLVFNETDPVTAVLGKKERPDLQHIPFKTHPYEIEQGRVLLVADNNEKIPVKIFGRQNLQNLSAAKEVLKKIGITADQFYQAIPGFAGAAGCLEKIRDDGKVVVFKDTAHAPPKVRASADAVKELYARQPLTGVLELNPHSQLTAGALPGYKNSLKACEEAIIFLDAEKAKPNGSPIDEQLIRRAFQHPNLTVIGSATGLQSNLANKSWNNRCLLLMSSGAWGGLDLDALAATLKA